jgi:hypothetical protein
MYIYKKLLYIHNYIYAMYIYYLVFIIYRMLYFILNSQSENMKLKKMFCIQI